MDPRKNSVQNILISLLSFNSEGDLGTGDIEVYKWYPI